MRAWLALLSMNLGFICTPAILSRALTVASEVWVCRAVWFRKGGKATWAAAVLVVRSQHKLPRQQRLSVLPRYEDRGPCTLMIEMRKDGWLLASAEKAQLPASNERP